MDKLFIFGLGYVGKALALSLQKQGWRVGGSTRSLRKQKILQDMKIETVIYDGTMPISEAVLSNYDHFLITISPEDEGCRAFLHHAHHLRVLKPKWIGYCSSTGVYGDHKGEWVTESSELKATFPTGLSRIKAEGQWSQFGTIAPVVLLRISGIYGPGRSILDQVKAGTAKRIVKPGHAFSRIHIDDICQIIIAALAQKTPGVEVYNLADDRPASSSELIEHACQLLGVAVPSEIPFHQAQLSPMGRQFYLDNKRVNNQKIREDLRVTLIHPSYVEGLESLVDI